MPERDQNRNAREGVRAGRGTPAPAPNPAVKLQRNKHERDDPPSGRRADSRPTSPGPRLAARNARPNPPLPPTFSKVGARRRSDARYWPSGRQGSENGVGSGASGAGVDAGAIGSGAGGVGLGAALRGAAFRAAGFGAAFLRAFAFLAFLPFAADLRAATFLRAPFAAALPRADFLFAFLLVDLAMLSVSFYGPLGRLHGRLPTSRPRMLKDAAAVKHGTRRNSRATVIDPPFRERP